MSEHVSAFLQILNNKKSSLIFKKCYEISVKNHEKTLQFAEKY